MVFGSVCFFMTLIVFNLCYGVLGKVGGEIVQLSGEPGFRSVELRWQTTREAARSYATNNITLQGYSVHYCELQSWGPLRCKDKQHALLKNKLDDRSLNMLDTDYNNKPDTDDINYSMKIGGLRMATTYSFHVKPIRSDQTNRTDRSDGNDGNTIIIPTKGFSARATQCLPQESVVEISTGPHFGGKISVEPSGGQQEDILINPECTVNGDPSDARESYMLRIDHSKCGSRVNETTVTTFIIVQENLPILTHSTRRFLVVCTFQPEVLTVRAGMSLPPRHPGIGFADVDLSSRRQNSARSLLHKGRAQLVLKSDYDDMPDREEHHKSGENNRRAKFIEQPMEPKNVHAARLVDGVPSVDEASVKDIPEKTFVSGTLGFVVFGAFICCVVVVLKFKSKKNNHTVDDSQPIDIANISNSLANESVE